MPYTHTVVGKKPDNYKIPNRDMERRRMQRSRIRTGDDFECLIQQKQLLETADKKSVYNRIRKLVECEMKANEHLFTEQPKSKSEPIVEVVQQQPDNPVEDVKAKADILKKQQEEEEQQIVEEKRLQMFIENSDELRSAATAKRKKEISNDNYTIILEKQRLAKEQKTKKKEMDNANHLETIRQQAADKEAKRQKELEKKLKLKNELTDQMKQKEITRKQQQEWARNDQEELKVMIEKLTEKEQNEKKDQMKKYAERAEEMKRFVRNRLNVPLKKDLEHLVDDGPFALTVQKTVQGDSEEEMDAKMRLKRENELFARHQATIRKERQRQNEEMSKIVSKQMDDIEEMKRLIAQKSDRARRERLEESNRILREQLESRKQYLDRQKEEKRKSYEQSTRDNENYLKDKKQQWEKEMKLKWQIRKDLTDQMEFRKTIIENQRKADLENHEKRLVEIKKQEDLLKTLLDDLKSNN
ncbi:calponin homology domain-containing protein DDB_G0272472-like [Adelges cooleyi]|uniref:calponin homology domain-containing protein DDB_G0272472-like n=1 Tax=Adelges cooleyi TaxID=133065 RepID=UPI0021801F09|nr:calponin homology domain-containing protein DDB_G0272472-like [Adelges cooleyi]XP_050431291.1 calponin homology domain-containing protein DDB_G0272472-like [Adelges cooleyi]